MNQKKTRSAGGAVAPAASTAVRASRTHSMSPPIHLAATHSYGSVEGFREAAASERPVDFYGRYGNATRQATEAILASLEGGEAALLTASGMAAASTSVAALLKAGDHVVAQSLHYAAVGNLVAKVLPRWGIESTLVDQTDAEAFARAVRPNTRLIIVESPSNPTLALTDLRAVADIARKCGAITLADNTLATPVNQRPLDLGIDLVFHSATKYLGGHSDLLAGAIIGSRKLVDTVWEMSLKLGAILGGFDSWLLHRGLLTLELRVERQVRSALAAAQFLEAHAKVRTVYYPGLTSHPQHALAIRQMRHFGGVVSLLIEGDADRTNRFLDALTVFRQAASFGCVESYAVRPTDMLQRVASADEFEQSGVPVNLVRLSMGIESSEVLIADLSQALSHI